MTTRAYFMINVADKFYPTGYLDVLRDLGDIREVRSVERIDGICDLLVEVEASGTMGSIADQIMPKHWVKGLRILNVEPVELGETGEIAMPDFGKVQTALPIKQ